MSTPQVTGKFHSQNQVILQSEACRFQRISKILPSRQEIYSGSFQKAIDTNEAIVNATMIFLKATRGELETEHRPVDGFSHVTSNSPKMPRSNGSRHRVEKASTIAQYLNEVIVLIAMMIMNSLYWVLNSWTRYEKWTSTKGTRVIGDQTNPDVSPISTRINVSFKVFV